MNTLERPTIEDLEIAYSMPSYLDTAVVMAGGVGTRDLPWSKLLPKELAEVYGLPLISHVVMDLIEAGVENVITVVGEDYDEFGQNYQEILHKRWFGPSERLEKYLIANNKAHLLDKLNQSRGVNFEYIRQPSCKKYGTAIPLYVAKPALKGVGRFISVNGDDLMQSVNGTPPLREYVESSKLSEAPNSMMVKRVTRMRKNAYPYGIALRDENGMLDELLEKPAAELITGIPLANVGKYIFEEHEILSALSSYVRLPRKKRNQDEYYLTDVISNLDQVYVHVTSSQFLDAGDKDLRLIAGMTKAGMPKEIIAAARKHLAQQSKQKR